MPLVSKRSRYVSGDLLILLSRGVEDWEGLTISTAVLSLGFLQTFHAARPDRASRTPLVKIISSLVMTARGSHRFQHWLDTEETVLEDYDVLGSVAGQGLFDVDDAIQCKRYLLQVAAELEPRLEFGIMSEEES